MKRLRWMTGVVVSMAMTGMLVPEQMLHAQGPLPRQTPGASQGATSTPTAMQAAVQVDDVALAAGGVLAGQVINAQGQPQAGARVTIGQNQRIVARATTDEQGNFAIRGLQGGIYQATIDDAGNTQNFRLWVADTAPPSAKRAALLVSGGDVVRGQGASRFRYWVTNPWVLSAGIAAAIAVPIALSNRSKVPSS